MPARDSVEIEILTETKKAVGDIAALTKGVTAAIVAFKALQGIATAAFEFADLAARFNQQSDAFENLTRSAGVNAKQLLADMKTMTRGTISELDLMRTASQANLLGIGFDKLPQLLQIADAAARGTGQSMTFMFDSITTGIARQSRLIIDNLGITVRVGEANEKYAAALGKTVEELTAMERQQAFANEVVDAGRDMVERMGSAMDDMTDPQRWQKFRAALEETKTTIGQTLLPAFRELADLSTRFLENLNEGLQRIQDRKSDLEIVSDILLGRITSVENTERLERILSETSARYDTIIDRQGELRVLEIELTRLRETAWQRSQQNQRRLIENKEAEIAALYEEASQLLRIKTAIEKVIETSNKLADSGGPVGATPEVVEQTRELRENIHKIAIDMEDILSQAIVSSSMGAGGVDLFGGFRTLANDINNLGAVPQFIDQVAKGTEDLVKSLTKMDALNKSGKSGGSSMKDFVRDMRELGQEIAKGGIRSVVEGMEAIGKTIGDTSESAQTMRDALADIVSNFMSTLSQQLLQAGLQAIIGGDPAMKWVGVGLIVASGLIALTNGIMKGQRDADAAEQGAANTQRARASRGVVGGPVQANGTIVINNFNIAGSAMVDRDMAAMVGAA